MRIGLSLKLSFFCLLFALSGRPLASTETNSLPAEIPVNHSEAAASIDTLRLQLQEQLHATKLAIMEQTRQDVAQANIRGAELLAARLDLIEQRLSTQRTGETRFIVYVLSGFAALSFLAVVLTTYFQWRTVSRLADFTAALPTAHSFAPANADALAIGDGLNSETVERSSHRLLGAVERLEKRIRELEHAAVPSLKSSVATETRPHGTNGHAIEAAAFVEPLASPTELDQSDRVKQLLEQGQIFLNEDKPESAVEAFDLVLALDADNTDALVKKGAALEKLRKLQEAIECYDRAIAADSSMTIAYLYKGGLYNRLERFGEAVECYEQALRTQEKRSAA
ncbi:MAG: tetratricopeptide repeat protein [Akkermansiaceae bacterium]|nr:tetratricopeptide repeat protein [Verrucomicrobiales bacterium]